MKIQTKKTYSFSLNAINNVKKQQLLDKAVCIRDLKNMISQNICKDFLNFQKTSKFDFVKSIKNPSPHVISGQDFQHAVFDVFTSYENKIDKFKEKMQFRIQKDLKVIHYKRNTKTHKKGEINSATLVFYSTKLSKVCSFLAKY